MGNLVSVIVPVYNVEQYLDTCIQSIVNQTYEEMEIILVDDGSTDKSGMICDGWAKKDKRVAVFHKQNGGLSDARNAGLEYANGEYIIFADSDDYIDSELVEYCYRLAKEHSADVVAYKWHTVRGGSNKKIHDYHQKQNNIEELTGTELLHDFMRNGKGCSVAWNKFYNRKIWKNLRFPIGKIHEDEFVIIDVLSSVSKAVVTCRKLYYYRQRAGSITNRENRKSCYDALEAFGQRCEKLKPDKELYCRSRNLYLLQMIRICSIEQKEKQADIIRTFRETMWTSFRYARWKMKILFLMFYLLPNQSLPFVRLVFRWYA